MTLSCLDIAEVMLDELEEMILESIKDEDIIITYLKVKGNYLENCCSH